MSDCRHGCPDHLPSSKSIAEPVALSDIARRLGVSKSAVSNYRARDRNFPEPVFEVANGTVPVFEWEKVKAWAMLRKTGIDGRYGFEVEVSP